MLEKFNAYVMIVKILKRSDHMGNDSTVKKIWRVAYPVGIYFAISNIISFVYMFMMAVLLQMQQISSGEEYSAELLTVKLMELINSGSLILTGISAAVTIPIIILLFRGDLKREAVKYEKTGFKNYWIIALMMPMLCIWSNNVIAMSRLSEIFTGVNQVNDILYSGGIVLEIIVVSLLAPIVEELIFRGLVFKRIYAYSSKWPAIIISSLFFGAYHMNVVQGIYAFIVGFMFSLIYDKYKTIMAPVFAHMLINFTAVIMTETEIFTPLYSNDAIYIASTIAAFALFLILVKAMNINVHAKEIQISGNDNI